MKILTPLFVTVFIGFGSSAFATEWEMNCQATFNAPGNTWAKLQGDDSLVLLRANIGYINTNLTCGYDGSCTGFTDLDLLSYGGEVDFLKDRAGKINGFRLGKFEFSCLQYY